MINVAIAIDRTYSNTACIRKVIDALEDDSIIAIRDTVSDELLKHFLLKREFGIFIVSIGKSQRTQVNKEIRDLALINATNHIIFFIDERFSDLDDLITRAISLGKAIQIYDIKGDLRNHEIFNSGNRLRRLYARIF